MRPGPAASTASASARCCCRWKISRSSGRWRGSAPRWPAPRRAASALRAPGRDGVDYGLDRVFAGRDRVDQDLARAARDQLVEALAEALRRGGDGEGIDEAARQG